jgi:hypothetical protein
MLRPLGTIKGDSTEMKRTLIQIAGVATTAFLLSFAPGCGGASPASPADTSEARSVLDRALTAWREGKPADSLKSEEPPLEASDHQWKNGLHLVKYEVQQHPLPSGSGQTFRVTLWLKDDHSRQTKVITQYDVATTSPIRVARAGF